MNMHAGIQPVLPQAQDFEESPFGGSLLPSVVRAAHWLLVGEGTVYRSCTLLASPPFSWVLHVSSIWALGMVYMGFSKLQVRPTISSNTRFQNLV